MKSALSSGNFYPVDINLIPTPIQLRWCNFKKEKFEDSFFERDILNLAYISSENFIETPLSELLTVSIPNYVRPNGFIFHMSRCGSTLVSNIFKQLDKNIVHSEPLIPLKILQLLDSNNNEYIFELLKCSINILGRKRFNTEENLVIKFFSGSTLFLPLLLQVFPAVPRIYMYRDPVEVLVSNMEAPDQFWIHSTKFTGQSQKQITEENSPLENCAFAIARKSEAFLEHYDHNCLVINYNQIGRELIEKLIDHFNMSFNESEIENMMHPMKYHSKSKNKEFIKDSFVKHEQASDKLRAVAEKIIGPVHEKLKRLTVQL